MLKVFKFDYLSKWKYIMIDSFIANDIIIVNKSNLMDEVKKILSIIWISLDKMNKLGLRKF